MTSPVSAEAIAAQIAELTRCLDDLPPHHASGTREAVERRLERLRAELARRRR